MFWNGESLASGFLEKLKESGRETALDNLPELDEEGRDLWKMHCFIGDDILVGADVYARRIGLPGDWEFEECVLLLSDLKRKARELEKQKRDDRQHSKQ